MSDVTRRLGDLWTLFGFSMRTVHKLCIAMILAMAICAVGCRESVEQRLGLVYAAPTIPDDLEQFFTPSPNQKAIEELRDGETKIDMHEYYRAFHKSGWTDAISEYERKVEREFKSERDVRMVIQAMQVGCEAYWIGYDEAYRRIVAETDGDSANPNAE